MFNKFKVNSQFRQINLFVSSSLAWIIGQTKQRLLPFSIEVSRGCFFFGPRFFLRLLFSLLAAFFSWVFFFFSARRFDRKFCREKIFRPSEREPRSCRRTKTWVRGRSWEEWRKSRSVCSLQSTTIRWPKRRQKIGSTGTKRRSNKKLGRFVNVNLLLSGEAMWQAAKLLLPL